MTDAAAAAYRAALRTPARFLILSLERRGAAITVTDAGRVLVRPARVLTDADRQGLRQHAEAVTVLIRHREDWYDWRTREVPAFDPARAFVSADDPRGQA